MRPKGTSGPDGSGPDGSGPDDSGPDGAPSAETRVRKRPKEPMVVVLQYHRGFASKLMDAIEFVQHPVKRDQVAHCPTLHYFYEDRSFLGLTVSSFAGAFFEFRSTGIPFQPVTSRKWTYADNSWHGCGGLHQLDCFFLPGSSCDLSKREWSAMAAPRKQLGGGVPGAILERTARGDFNRTDITKYRKISNMMFRRYPAGDWRTMMEDMTTGAIAEHKVDNRDFAAQLRNKILATHATFLQVFLRPNYVSRIEIRSRVAQWKAANPGWQCGAGGALCVGMHVRHGDKLTHYWMNSSTMAGSGSCFLKAAQSISATGCADGVGGGDETM